MANIQLMLGKVTNPTINQVWAKNVNKTYSSSNQQLLSIANTFGNLENVDSTSYTIMNGPGNQTPNGPISPRSLKDAIMGQQQKEVVKNYPNNNNIIASHAQSTTSNTSDPNITTLNSNYRDIFIQNNSKDTDDLMETKPLSLSSNIASTGGLTTTPPITTNDMSEAASDKHKIHLSPHTSCILACHPFPAIPSSNTHNSSPTPMEDNYFPPCDPLSSIVTHIPSIQ